MSAQNMSVALRTKGLTASQKVLYAYLCDRANGHLVCWPSVETIGADIELSRSAVLAGLSVLRKRMLIRVETRYRQTSCYYILPQSPDQCLSPGQQSGIERIVSQIADRCDPPDCGHILARLPEAYEPAPADDEAYEYHPGNYRPESAPQDHPAEPSGVQILPSEVQNPHSKGPKSGCFEVQNLDPESPIESPIESPKPLTVQTPMPRAQSLARMSDPPGWSDFWEIYPPHDGNYTMARLAYGQALAEGVTPAQLLEAVRHFPFRHGRWCVQAVNWLRERRWMNHQVTAEFDPALSAVGFTPGSWAEYQRQKSAQVDNAPLALTGGGT